MKEKSIKIILASLFTALFAVLLLTLLTEVNYFDPPIESTELDSMSHKEAMNETSKRTKTKKMIFSVIEDIRNGNFNLLWYYLGTTFLYAFLISFFACLVFCFFDRKNI